MYYNIPSIKRMIAELRLDLPIAKLARRVMEARCVSELETLMGVYSVTVNEDIYRTFTHARAWYCSCYNQPGYVLVKMYMLNDLLNGYGVEFQSAGTNAKSPQFEYVNMGDTYTATILYINGRGFKVTNCGTVIEKGNYR